MSPQPPTIDPSELRKLSDVIQDTAASEMFAKGKAILGDENLLGVLNRTVNPITANNQQKEREAALWSFHYENTKDMNFIKEAINARHKFFKGTRQSLECGPNINKTMEKFKSEELKSFNQLQSIFNGLKESNNIALEYNNSMNVLKSGKLNELKGVKSKIDTYKQNLHIDGRKNDYSSKNLDFYKSIHFYVLILYFFLLGLYFIYSDFYSSEKYKNKYYLIALILYIIFPFLLPYILFYIHYAYDYYLEYYNLKEDVVSYPDIVNKYHNK
jgi:hypothetical protein